MKLIKDFVQLSLNDPYVKNHPLENIKQYFIGGKYD